jgi:hypothetical protein
MKAAFWHSSWQKLNTQADSLSHTWLFCLIPSSAKTLVSTGKVQSFFNKNINFSMSFHWNSLLAQEQNIATYKKFIGRHF